MARKGIEYLLSDEKRRLDIAGGLALAAALMPVGAAVGTACALETGKLNALLMQRRSGGGKEFSTWKFRTIPPHVGEDTGVAPASTSVPQARKLGRMISKTGLDELPQLYSVLIGDMSLVGPRPILEARIELNQISAPDIFDEWYGYFTLVKPGLTGEGQMNRHQYARITEQVLRETMEMDLRYFESATLAQDLKWLGATPLKMLHLGIGTREAA